MIIEVPNQKDTYPSVTVFSGTNSTFDETVFYDEVNVASGAVLTTQSGLVKIFANNVNISGTVSGAIVEIYAYTVTLNGKIQTSAGNITIDYITTFTNNGTLTPVGGTATSTKRDLT